MASEKIEGFLSRLPILPEEVIEEILSRLPVKSVLKFRCLSKSWLSLIGSQVFIEAHLHNSTKNTTLAHHRVITVLRGYGLQQRRLELLLNGSLLNSSPIDLVGCCNGLVCFLIDNRYFILWNPSTRTSNKLPDVDSRFHFVGECGFGYDELSSDYKVFAVVRKLYKHYSLKTNSWRIVKESDDRIPFDKVGTFVSGRLHWTIGHSIVSFDLNGETHESFEQPCYAVGEFYRSMGAVRGCLSVLTSCCMFPCFGDASLNIWVMKQYGVTESWDKVVSFPFEGSAGKVGALFCIGSDPQVLRIGAVQFWTYSGGEYPVNLGSSFRIYCPKDNMVGNPQIFHFDPYYEAGLYVESLVSPFSPSEKDKQAPEKPHLVLEMDIQTPEKPLAITGDGDANGLFLELCNLDELLDFFFLL